MGILEKKSNKIKIISEIRNIYILYIKEYRIGKISDFDI